MGKCRVELSATVNLGNFQSVKATVGFEEDYPQTAEFTEGNRNHLFNELLAVCEEKLDKAILTEVARIQALTGKKDKTISLDE